MKKIILLIAVCVCFSSCTPTPTDIHSETLRYAATDPTCSGAFVTFRTHSYCDDIFECPETDECSEGSGYHYKTIYSCSSTFACPENFK